MDRSYIYTLYLRLFTELATKCRNFGTWKDNLRLDKRGQLVIFLSFSRSVFYKELKIFLPCFYQVIKALVSFF